MDDHEPPSNRSSFVNPKEVFEKSQVCLDPDQPELLQVGNFLIDEERVLGAGEFGKVYLAQEIPESFDVTRCLFE